MPRTLPSRPQGHSVIQRLLRLGLPPIVFSIAAVQYGWPVLSVEIAAFQAILLCASSAMASAESTSALLFPPPRSAATSGASTSSVPQLGVWPSKLHFTCTKEAPGQQLRLRLTNRSSDRPVMYKVKTTAPNSYRVRPNAATIPAGETVDVGVLLLPMQEYPEQTKRKDRFLVQAAWVDSASDNVIELWSQLQQTVGKAGKGTAWAEYKLESQLTVPSIVSQSIIFEDDEEGSTPGSTPAKGSPRGDDDERSSPYINDGAASTESEDVRDSVPSIHQQLRESESAENAAPGPAETSATFVGESEKHDRERVCEPQTQLRGSQTDEADELARQMMEETNKLVQAQIFDDMVNFQIDRPRATVAHWARSSDWGRDTGGPRDKSGAPVRAMEGEWAALYDRAEREASNRRQWPLLQLRDLLRGEGLTLSWWLALSAVPTCTGLLGVLKVSWTGILIALVLMLWLLLSAPATEIARLCTLWSQLRPHMGKILMHSRCLCRRRAALRPHFTVLVEHLDLIGPHMVTLLKHESTVCNNAIGLLAAIPAMSEADAAIAASNMHALAPHLAELLAFGLWLPLLRDYKRYSEDLDKLLAVRRDWPDISADLSSVNLQMLHKQMRTKHDGAQAPRSDENDDLGTS